MRLPGWLCIGTVAGLSLVGCSSDPPATTARPCAGVVRSSDPAATLPSDVPAPASATFVELEKQGATRRYFAQLPGDNVVQVRDEVLAQFRTAGYQIVDSDAEGNAEAEFDFRGAHEGSLAVTPLCDGMVQLRFRLSS